MGLDYFDLLFVFVVGILVLGLQYVLSTRKNRLWGFILPVMTLGYSLYMLPRTDIFSDLSTGYQVYMMIRQNITTIVLLVIYFACRWNMKKRSES